MPNKKRRFTRQYQLAGVVLIALLLITAGAWQTWQDSPRSPKLPAPSLKELAAKHDIQIGNFAILTRLDEKPYTDILVSQHDFVTIDNIPNWHFTNRDLRPSPTEYDYTEMDKVVEFAKTNNMPMQAHHFLWGEEKWLPDWLLKGGYTKDQLYGLMEDHIKTVGGRYKGVINEWTVVNEAFSRDKHVFDLRDWWADATGSMDYIDKAFLWARQADPKAKLILNDFNNEGKNDISDAMYEYIKGALVRGIPIDGIGMQMHIDGVHPPTKDEVKENMERFGALGIKIYVTELDVNMNDVKAPDKDRDNIQANIYYEMARACIESKVCNSFALLGITDKETWYNYLSGTPNARPLPFDKNYQPKPAFFSLRDAFAEN